MEILAVSGNLEVLVRLVIALVLGSLVGIERSMVHKPAGMRTYALISMASAVLIIISELVIKKYAGTAGIDPLRMASAIIQGIGFIGAGLFFLNHQAQQQHVSGVTTAVGLWVATVMGIIVGYGLYGIALILAILTLFVFSVMWVLEEKVVELADEAFDRRDGSRGERTHDHKVS